jgi:2-keto-4-pentenoate hydratase/2-oxohepta-3-ene-1,7-dioic acid hydratase in catechol pathway
MKRIAIWTGAVLGILVVAVLAATLWVSRPLFDARLDEAELAAITIAPPEEALTFARFREGGRLRILLVRGYAENQVSGFEAERLFGARDTDPIALFAKLGYHRLARGALSAAPQETVPVSSLVLPFDTGAAHIGIGTNYREHAREAGVPEQPFLFPKLVQPTTARAPVRRGDSRLLDYEAELGLVALEDITAATQPRHMGLVLGNDFTDRWSLVRNFERGGEMGTSGFVEGKSREGYAPIGPLLVIPRDLEAFYPKVELALYVNGRLRQRERAGAMSWGPQEMLREVFRRESWTFRRYGGEVPLLARAGTIPRGTIIFSGTPAGVIFKPLNLWNSALYLDAGDEVVMRSDFLGVLQNRIE